MTEKFAERLMQHNELIDEHLKTITDDSKVIMEALTTYDTASGAVCTPLESRPVIIVKKSKRKINPLFEELIKNVPEETKRLVEKQMTCNWLCNGDECAIKVVCNPQGCLSWEEYKEGQR